MRTKLFYLMTLIAFSMNAQTNVATTSGNWNKCATWNFPAVIYNSDQNDKAILPGVVVTQNLSQVYARTLWAGPPNRIWHPASS